MENPITGARVLVTGASGTVGNAVARRFVDRGAAVRAMTRGGAAPIAGAELVHADLADVPALRRAMAGCALVVHCAAAVSHEEAACRAANIDGVHHLVTALREERVQRLVHVSTVSVYDWRRGPDFDEDSAMWTEPLDVYGYTKAESERIIGAAGVAAVILRPVMVLSTHPRSFWGPLALERARTRPEPVMPLAAVPYVHVDNLASAIELAATEDVALARAYDVIDGLGDTGEYLAAVSLALGKPVTPTVADAPRFNFAGERLRRELGWAPVDHWRQFLHELAALGS